MRLIKSAVYKMNSRRPRTDLLWHAKPHDLLCRPSRTASHTLHPARQVGLEPVQRNTTDTEEDLEPCQPDVVVDGIKCCGQVEQDEDREVADIDCIQNVRQYFSARPSRYVTDMHTAVVAEGLPPTGS